MTNILIDHEDNNENDQKNNDNDDSKNDNNNNGNAPQYSFGIRFYYHKYYKNNMNKNEILPGTKSLYRT